MVFPIKKLTLDIYERIIDAVYAKCLNNLKMLGHITKSECADYIGFYALNNGLFWSEQNGVIVGVATAHPEKKEVDWTWEKPNGIWTAHLVWAENKQAMAELLIHFLQNQQSPVTELWACRRRKIIALTKEKIERVLFYGRRNNNSSATSAAIQRVNEGDPSGSSGHGSTGVCAGADLSA